MKISFINPAALAEPSGYNNGVLVEGGQLLFVAGQIGWDRTRRIVSDDFADQFALALENVLAIVREAGGDASSIVNMRVYITDKKEYTSRLKEIGSVYRQVMGKHFPAMALVEVSALVEDLAKVEIEAMACIEARPQQEGAQQENAKQEARPGPAEPVASDGGQK
jgi:enamine deaminase RidA (YjgF/YER057c/UK114 family)